MKSRRKWGGDLEESSETSPRLQICPLYIFGNNPPQMVPRDLNIGFQGVALIQGQIYNPVIFRDGMGCDGDDMYLTIPHHTLPCLFFWGWERRSSMGSQWVRYMLRLVWVILFYDPNPGLGETYSNNHHLAEKRNGTNFNTTQRLDVKYLNAVWVENYSNVDLKIQVSTPQNPLN